ncbi:RING-type domain-containing protein [Mycena venus]|uniref:RING-type domain-containing protein n=1 Tax=Mycena venus TaxID=2733690 RepID=A0A8H6Z1D4_9AGAR|nr:RING-type domain-containing protein [Mycena venus]
MDVDHADNEPHYDSDDSMPELQSVSNSSDSEDEDEYTSPAYENQGQSSNQQQSGSTGDDTDQDRDRDRRHPSQRVNNINNNNNADSIPPPLAPNPNPTPANANANVNANPGVRAIPIPVGAGAPQLAQLFTFLTRLGTGGAPGAAGGNNADFGAFAGGPIPIPNLGQFLFGGMGLHPPPPPPKDSPANATRIIAGLTRVPEGLVRRLERVSALGNGGSGDGKDELGAVGGDSGCAICWDRLLDGDGAEFASTATANATASNHDPPSDPPAPPTSSSPAPPEETGKEDDLGSGIISLPCAHVFHAACLLPWFSRPGQTTCPTCRFDVDPEGVIWYGGRKQQRERFPFGDLNFAFARDGEPGAHPHPHPHPAADANGNNDPNAAAGAPPPPFGPGVFADVVDGVDGADGVWMDGGMGMFGDDMGDDMGEDVLNEEEERELNAAVDDVFGTWVAGGAGGMLPPGFMPPGFGAGAFGQPPPPDDDDDDDIPPLEPIPGRSAATAATAAPAEDDNDMPSLEPIPRRATSTGNAPPPPAAAPVAGPAAPTTTANTNTNTGAPNTQRPLPPPPPNAAAGPRRNTNTFTFGLDIVFGTLGPIPPPADLTGVAPGGGALPPNPALAAAAGAGEAAVAAPAPAPAVGTGAGTQQQAPAPAPVPTPAPAQAQAPNQSPFAQLANALRGGVGLGARGWGFGGGVVVRGITTMAGQEAEEAEGRPGLRSYFVGLVRLLKLRRLHRLVGRKAQRPTQAAGTGAGAGPGEQTPAPEQAQAQRDPQMTTTTTTFNRINIPITARSLRRQAQTRNRQREARDLQDSKQERGGAAADLEALLARQEQLRQQREQLQQTQAQQAQAATFLRALGLGALVGDENGNPVNPATGAAGGEGGGGNAGNGPVFGGCAQYRWPGARSCLPRDRPPPANAGETNAANAAHPTGANPGITGFRTFHHVVHTHPGAGAGPPNPHVPHGHTFHGVRVGDAPPSETPGTAPPAQEWAPPPAPGPTLRDRVERREREAGAAVLRCKLRSGLRVVFCRLIDYILFDSL